MNSFRNVLVSNDDGIHAAGLRALVDALVEANCCNIMVCAPSGERSAQSHAITLGRYLSCSPVQVAGSVEAYAVDGTPADSVMLALNGPVFKVQKFDLVVSGINRGDNCGLHVIYSGTVGAAREAACKGVPAVAFSLNNHLARSKADYLVSARLCIPIIKAALGLLPGVPADLGSLSRCVLNVNFPAAAALEEVQGMYLAHQGVGCVHPAYKQVSEQPGPHLPEIDEHTPPEQRMFRNYAGVVEEDNTEGSDMWAVQRGWVSLTPLSLRSDIPITQAAFATHHPADAVQATTAILQAAAAASGLAAGGVSKL